MYGWLGCCCSGVVGVETDGVSARCDRLLALGEACRVSNWYDGLESGVDCGFVCCDAGKVIKTQLRFCNFDYVLLALQLRKTVSTVACKLI